MMMRLADAEVLPFQFTDFADTIHTYITELKKLATDQRAEIKERNAEIEEGVFAALMNPKKKMVPPRKNRVPPYLNFAPLDNAADELTPSRRELRDSFDWQPGIARRQRKCEADPERTTVNQCRRFAEPPLVSSI